MRLIRPVLVLLGPVRFKNKCGTPLSSGGPDSRMPGVRYSRGHTVYLGPPLRVVGMPGSRTNLMLHCTLRNHFYLVF